MILTCFVAESYILVCGSITTNNKVATGEDTSICQSQALISVAASISYLV
jgi:hypothetical protein